MPNSTTRTEVDAIGPIEVPAQALWGAQTARSLQGLGIGHQRMPIDIIHGIAWIKWAAARASANLHLLDMAKAKAIELAARRVADGEVDDQFPLSVWQTGSGAQSHANVNEVIASLASAALRVAAGPRLRVDAHEVLDLGLSSPDVFSSAMRIAVALRVKASLLPALTQLRIELAAKAHESRDVVLADGTHRQDAAPRSLGQQFGGFESQLALCDGALRHALLGVHRLALGGSAAGRRDDVQADFGARVADLLAQRLDLPLVPASPMAAALPGHEALVAFHGALRTLAVVLLKIGNDIRWLCSSADAGATDGVPPASGPGQAAPPQTEALAMVCAQVMGHDSAVAFAASQGSFGNHGYQPLIAHDVLDSLRLLADAMYGFAQQGLAGLQANRQRLQPPSSGDEPGAQITHPVLGPGLSLPATALAPATLRAEPFDVWIDSEPGPDASPSPRNGSPARLNGAHP